MKTMTKRVLSGLILVQTMAIVALLTAISAAYNEAQVALKSNAQNFTIVQMQADNLGFSFSTVSRNKLLITCFNAMNSVLALASDAKTNQDRANICALRANEIIAKEPNMSLAWIVLADSLVANGVYTEIEKNLFRSKKGAPNEGWLAQARLVVFLKVSGHIDLTNNEVFKSDASLVLKNSSGARWLARQWSLNKSAQPAIEASVSLAARSEQNRFLRMLR